MEQQFIRFSTSIDPSAQEIPILVSDDIVTSFFVNEYTQDPQVSASIMTADGRKTILGNCMQRFIQNQTGYMHMTLRQNLANYLAPYECFRIQIDEDQGHGALTYSNLLRYVPNERGYLSSLEYRCNEDEFNIPFGKFPNNEEDAEYYRCAVALPIRLSAPQFAQDDKIYEKLNGEQVVLYATITKEYQGETDYIPESWHERIVTALSCDEVYINNERVTKSDSYEIDHDNYTLADNGEKLTRATFKVKTNTLKRNSNY